MKFAILIFCVPLVCSLFGFVKNKKFYIIPLIASIFSFIGSLFILFNFLANESSTKILQYFNWFSTPITGTIKYEFRIDAITVSFCFMITLVAMLVHIYSIGYMKKDPEITKFFGFLNLFLASMLILVLSNNFAITFLGWEGVGLSSYLLIGFWNYNKEYAVAAKKAFITNKIGDVGFIIAIAIIAVQFNSLSYSDVLSGNKSINGWIVLLLSICLLIAACGKSAQFPLQSWLSDAMAGPTPVSALIHAATMVTAGVYLVVRTNIFFTSNKTAQLLVIIVGAISILYGAIVGSVKDDMKKVLANSTMSQIGYMMLAAGLGPIGAVFAIMHLLVHGFFKAGLFLGAGSVMHSMNDSVDIRKFGNLHKYMKITWITFLISWLAILGVPPFSAFWTKDKIITDAFTTNSIGGFIIGFIVLIAAGITSYYMSRLFFLIFYGKERWNKNEYKPHESDKTMTIPMIILAIFSICAGFLMSLFNFEGWMLSNINCGKYTTNCSKTGEMHTILPESLIMFLTLLFVVIGALLAWKLFAINKLKEQNNNKIITIVRDDLYQNQINNTLLVIPGRFISKALNLFDIRILNRLVNGIGSFFRGLSNLTLKSQTGNTRIYAVGIGIGIIILLIAVLLGGI